jgi:hypothetical protein
MVDETLFDKLSGPGCIRDGFVTDAAAKFLRDE